MKTILILTVLLLGAQAWADSRSNDFGSHSGEVKNLTNQKLREQLVIEGNIYVLNGSGEKLLFEAREERTWKFAKDGDLLSHWSFKADKVEPIALKHRWKLGNDGRLHVDIKQYSSMEKDPSDKDPKVGKLVKEKKFVLSNFEPITWKVRQTKEETVVVRLTPRLIRKQEAQQVGRIPISGKNMIMADNKGFVWTPDATFSGQFVSLKTNRGTVHLSYQKFSGAKELGTASENKMRVNLGKKHYLNLISTAPLLPHGLEAKVYGKVDLSSKAQPGSTHIISSDQEKEFLSSIK